MPNSKSILISIKNKYVESIIQGLKKSEIRRLFPSGDSISRIYVYVPTPNRHVAGYFDIKKVNRLPVEQLWETSGQSCALSKADFFDYLSGKDTGISIDFDSFTLLDHKLSLAELRKHYHNFHPPQSFMYVNEEMERIFLNC